MPSRALAGVRGPRGGRGLLAAAPRPGRARPRRRAAEADQASIASTEAWVAREPNRAEAWFYLGGAYGTRVLLRGTRGQYPRRGPRRQTHPRFAATGDQAGPTLGDAYFGLGLYHYYAAIAPRAARILSMLLFLPGGDRAGGLREMEQTRPAGCSCAGRLTTSCTSSTSGTNVSRQRRFELIEGLAGALSAQSGVPSSARRGAGELLARSSRGIADLSAVGRCRTRRARGDAGDFADTGASRYGSGDGCAVPIGYGPRTAARSHRTESDSAVRRACARLLSTRPGARSFGAPRRCARRLSTRARRNSARRSSAHRREDSRSDKRHHAVSACR